MEGMDTRATLIGDLECIFAKLRAAMGISGELQKAIMGVGDHPNEEIIPAGGICVAGLVSSIETVSDSLKARLSVLQNFVGESSARVKSTDAWQSGVDCSVGVRSGVRITN